MAILSHNPLKVDWLISSRKTSTGNDNFKLLAWSNTSQIWSQKRGHTRYSYFSPFDLHLQVNSKLLFTIHNTLAFLCLPNDLPGAPGSYDWSRWILMGSKWSIQSNSTSFQSPVRCETWKINKTELRPAMVDLTNKKKKKKKKKKTQLTLDIQWGSE